MKRALFRVLIPVLVVGLLLPTMPLTAQAQRRDAVSIGLAQEPDLLGPYTIMAVSGVIHNTVFGYISMFNDKWERVPIMAEKLPTLKDGDWVLLPNKRMKVTWKLKRGFTWHDGKPVTALDWRFTYGAMRNPLAPPPSGGRFVLNKVDNVLVPNPNDPYEMVVQRVGSIERLAAAARP